MRIEGFDPQEASEAVLLGVHEVNAAVEAEDLPDDPPVSYEQRRARLLTPMPAHNQIVRWIAFDGDRVVASSWVLRWPKEDPDTGLVSIRVLPDFRRRGLGTRLLELGLETMAEAGSKRVIIDCVNGRPWEAELSRLGFANVLHDKKSRLRFAEVDWDLMDHWIASATEKATDYELISFTSPVPEEYLERFCRVHDVMNTAPLEGLEIADRKTTPEIWRSVEAMIAGRGDAKLITVAVHRPSGEFVGYTDVSVDSTRKKASQDDTAVDPAHRNQGLGRWLKASMAKWLISEFPDVAWIDTSNVESNAAMLAINVEMGFKPILHTNAWQADIATVRENLA